MVVRRPGIISQFRQIIAGLLTLVQTLAGLTAAELKGNFGALRGTLLLLLAAGGLLLTALTLLTVACVLALATKVGAVYAALIVACGAALAGLALGRHGLSKLEQTRLAPQRSIATLQAQIDRIKGEARPPENRSPRAPAEGSEA
jgi:hypothetical protein